MPENLKHFNVFYVSAENLEEKLNELFSGTNSPVQITPMPDGKIMVITLTRPSPQAIQETLKKMHAKNAENAENAKKS
jgi:hypothetical protein